MGFHFFQRQWWSQLTRKRQLSSPDIDSTPIALPSVQGIPLPEPTVSVTDLPPAGFPQRLLTGITGPAAEPGPFDPLALDAHLDANGNAPGTIMEVLNVLSMETVIVEIGCGSAEVAWQIAVKNPGIGVIATDIYQLPCSTEPYSDYGKVARIWRNRMLRAQIFKPANLAIIRTEADILPLLPRHSIDTLMMINPEPRVGKSFLDYISENERFENIIKPGPLQIVVKPFSRVTGMADGCCLEFEHGSDGSRGLGFLMESRFAFRKGNRVQWFVDLNSASAYSRRSTQQDVYVHGCFFAAAKPRLRNRIIDQVFRIRRPHQTG